MHAARSSFASFDAHERNRKGINGALTPARAHRSSHQQKNTNDYHHHPASTSTPNSAYPSDRTPSRLRHRQERLVGGEGISLQETEARIDELERGEFDLKLKLFYMEEQLASATGGDDGLQLHKEVIDAKLVRGEACAPNLTLSRLVYYQIPAVLRPAIRPHATWKLKVLNIMQLVADFLTAGSTDDVDRQVWCSLLFAQTCTGERSPRR